MFVRSYLQLHTVTWNHVDVAGFEPFISLTLVHSNILDVFQQHTFYLLLLRLLSVLHTAGMSVNSSSPSNSALNAVNSDCSPVSSATISITRVCIHVPLSIFILYLGYQQWRIQRSFRMMSHSDIFTYHITMVELFWCLGTVVYYCGYFLKIPHVMTVGYWFTGINFSGQMCFHLLACVDRYLAVVHPLIYRALRHTGGIKIRNICIGCVWLLCFMWTSVTNLYNFSILNIPFFCLLAFSLAIVSYCSLCVLYSLTYPGLREEGRDRELTDKSKQTAFFTIMAILATLSLWFLGNLVTCAIFQLKQLSRSVECTLWALVFCFGFPNTLVLPLLYLRKIGKLSCRHSDNGQR